MRAAGVPWARTRPACISERRSQRSASFMKWVEMNRVTPCSRESLQQLLPEAVAGNRIDPGGGLVQDQELRLVDHRHRQRQALADAERQFLGAGVEVPGQVEALG